MQTCAIDGCDKINRAKGLCGTHYNQTRANRHAKSTLTCDACGTQFTREARSNRYTGTYCSWTCRAPKQWATERASKAQVAIYKPAPTWHKALEWPTDVHARSSRVFISGTCVVCGESYLCLFGSRACSATCQEIAWRNLAHESGQRRRARKRDAFVAPVYRLMIFNRDNWTCQLCLGPIDRHATSPNPLAPSIDHIIPLARGGTHEPSNAQATHLLCNSTKSDRTEWLAAAPLGG